MHAFTRDLRYGARALLRDKGFSATVLLTLAIGVGANAVTFAVVYSVLLRPLPVPNADRIVLMSNRYPKAGAGDLNTSSIGDYYDRLTSVTALDSHALFRSADQAIDIGDTPEQVTGMAVTPSLFPLIGVGAGHGRTFTTEEGEIGHEHKVILSHALWQNLYGGAAGAIGRELRIGGRPYTIVGVMSAGFNFVDPAVRFWIPLAFTPEQKSTHHNNNWYHIGRLKQGATVAQVQAQVDAQNAANLQRFPEFRDVLINAGFYTKVEPLRDMIVRDVKPALYLLWGGAIFVLLIGVLNLANVVLARSVVRRKEIATRLALGGGRGQLVRQFVTEHVLIATTGGTAGLLLGAALLRSLALIGFERFPRASEVQISAVVVGWSLAISVLTGIAMGLVPLTHVLEFNLSDVLHDRGRTGTGGVRMRRARQILVGAEIGLAFVLLTGAGLLLASFRNLLNADLGFSSDHVLTASTNTPRSRYSDDGSVLIFMRRALDSIRALPGVVSAGATTAIPFGGDYSDNVILAEGYLMKPGESVISPTNLSITPGYLETMKIALIRGRYFNDHDDESAEPVVIVDQKLAHHFWPDRDPIGRRMYQPNGRTDLMKTDANTRWLRVVGVVRSVRLKDLAGAGTPVGGYYTPFAQDLSRGFTFALKLSGDSGTAERELRSRIAHIDPELPLFDIRTMTERAGLSLSSRRTAVALALGFGVIAVFLSAVGIYGVLAYLVSQRRREIGIRVALGGTAAAVVRLILSEGLRLLSAGLIFGVLAALALRKVLATQVYGVQPYDPMILSGVIVVLTAICAAACIVPAKRALAVNPVTALAEQ
jgi:predicted permease